jgi:hypothetical protein
VNLKTFKLNKVDSRTLHCNLPLFTNLNHLRLANLEFIDSMTDTLKLVPLFKGIKTLEVIACKLNAEFLGLIGTEGVQISTFTYIDNSMDAKMELLRNLKLQLNFVTHLTCCTNFVRIFKDPKGTDFWEDILDKFPNCEELSHYKRKLSNQLKSSSVAKPVTSFINIFADKRTKVKKYT